MHWMKPIIKDKPDEACHGIDDVLRSVYEPAAVALVHDDADVSDVAMVRKGIGHSATHHSGCRKNLQFNKSRSRNS